MLVVLAEVIDTQDVIVRDIAGHAGFGQEALLGFGVLATGFGEDLESHGTADHGIASAIHVRHASTEEFLEFVFADSGGKLHSGILSRLGQTGTITESRAGVLYTGDSMAICCNRLETFEIIVVEMVSMDIRNGLTEKGLRGIVEKVPRGLRNSKPPET